MNKLKKILYLLLIIPLLSVCLVGCGKKKIELTNENINDYLVVNYEISYDPNNSYNYLLTIETQKKVKNIEFENCEILCEILNYNNNKSLVIPRSVIDYNGYMKCSVHLYTGNQQIDTVGAKLTLSAVKGYVLVG